jgi:acyl-CoA synthetase (NDP forming)
MMEVSELIGQKLIKVVEPWDGDLEQDQVQLMFEGGTLMVSAIGDSWRSSASIYLKVNDETT